MGIGGKENKKNFLRVGLVFMLAALLVLGCAGSSSKKGKRSKSLSKDYIKKKRRAEHPASEKRRKSLPRRQAMGTHEFLFPTIVNIPDQAVMILVSSGKYAISFSNHDGKPASNTKPSTRLELLFAFYIDQTEITVKQYKRFDKSYDEKLFTDGKECPNCPAMGIDWNSAQNYCLWAKKRLPTEAEWEAAARGRSKYTWPWGNKFLMGRANLLGDGDGYPFVAPVGSMPLGSSPIGLQDMAGNVWEWIGRPHSPLPAGEQQKRIAKGGGWRSGKKATRISFRNIVHPALKNPTFGFRCAKASKRNPN